MASIEKRKDGSYRVIVSCGYDVNGKKIRKSKTIKLPPNLTERQKQKELERQKILFEHDVQNKTYLDGEKLTFAEISELWIEKYAKIKYAPATLKPCLARLKDRIIPELGHLKLSKIQTYHLEEFYNKLRNNGSRLEDFYTPTIIMSEFLSKYTNKELQKITGITNKTCKRIKEGQKTNIKTAQKICNSFGLDFNKMFKMTNEKPLSDKTIKNHHTDISAIFSFAERWGLIHSNPAKKVDLGKISKKQVKYYDDIQTAKLFKALENEPFTYRTIIFLALDVGLRSGELCGLKWEDVNFDTGVLSINKQRQYVSTYGIMERQPKTENGIRTITLSSQIITMLKQYKQKQAEDKLRLGSAWKNGEYLFKHDDGQDLHPTRPYKWFMKFLKRHNLPKITFHELRHTNASLLIANGVDAVTLSKRLGHADKTVTLNTYSHAIQSKETQAATTMDNLYSKLKKKCL